MQGLWLMRYHTEDQGRFLGGGVMYADGARVWGGDSGMHFVGELEEEGGGIKGRLVVTKFVPEFVSIFEGFDEDQFVLQFNGGMHPERFWAAATVEGRPDVRCSVTLERVA